MEAKRRGVRLVLFPCPFQGHINPMLQLASILYSNGFSITIVHTHFNSPKSSNYPNFTFIPIPDGLSEAQASSPDVIATLSLLNINCAVPLRDCLVGLLSDDNTTATNRGGAEAEPILCLISDSFMHFTQGVADSLKLPRLALRASSVECFLVHAAYPVLRQKGYLPVSDSQLEMPVPGFPPLRVKDLPMTKTRDPETLYQFLSSIVNQTKASSGIIWNTFDHLEQSGLAKLGQQSPIPVFPIGPLHKLSPAISSSLSNEDHSCIAWLNKQAPKSVIYVSFGSIASMDEAEFVEMAWGLANCKCPFLWVVRSGLVRGSGGNQPLWPDGFLEMISGNGLIVKWAPQLEVLAHPSVGGFWTHNGWNSTLESICEGVPMLCRPIFADQMMNARYVSQVWRVGLQLENRLERGEIERTIRRLMVEKEGEEIRDRAASLKEKAEVCVRNGGSSHASLENLIARILSF